MSNITAVSKTAYERKKGEFAELFEHTLDAGQLILMMGLLDTAVKEGFRRGYSAGSRMDIKDQLPADAVFLARMSSIECPSTLANLYSKERGYKQ